MIFAVPFPGTFKQWTLGRPETITMVNRLSGGGECSSKNTCHQQGTLGRQPQVKSVRSGLHLFVVDSVCRCRTKRVILIQRLLLFLHFWKQQQVLSGIHFCPDIKQEPMLAADWRLEKLLSVVVTDSWI
jgi:hypothetical protein